MKIKEINYDFLGKLFVYYRHQKNLSRNDIKDIILKNTNEDISTKTIQRIESGEYSRYKDIYYELAKIYDFDFLYDEVIYKEIKDISFKTCNIINSGEKITRYEKLLEENRELLVKYKNYIYISHLLRLNIATLEYYLEGTFNDEDIIYLLKEIAFSLKDEPFDMAMYLLSCASEKNTLGMNYADILTYGKFIKDKRIFLLELSSYELVQWETVLEFHSKHAKLLDALPDLKTNTEIIMTLEYLSFIELNSQAYKESLAHIYDITKIPDWNLIIPNRFYYVLIKRKGTVSYFAKKYEQCFNSLSLIVKDRPHLLGFNVIFLFKSAEKIGKIAEVIELVGDYNGERDSDKKIYAYFMNKYRGTKDLRNQEELILGGILPNLNEAGSTIYLDIFHEEMRELVKDSGDVDMLVEYEEKRRKE